MILHQTVFDRSGIKSNPQNLTSKDLKIYGQWKRIEVDCPWCLLRAPLNLFVVYHKRLIKGQREMSKKRAQCPRCYNGTTIKTLFKITEMSAFDYALWFWEAIFEWNSYERVKWDDITATIKRWSYEDRQEFWGVYRQMSNKHPEDAPYQMTADEIREERKFLKEYERKGESEHLT